MSAPPLPETPLPGSWGQVLDRMLQTLDGAVTALTERERQLKAAPPAELLAEREAKRRQAFAGVEQGLDRLRASVEQAEQRTTEMEALLAADADALHQWHAATAAAGQRLANGGAGGV